MSQEHHASAHSSVTDFEQRQAASLQLPVGGSKENIHFLRLARQGISRVGDLFDLERMDRQAALSRMNLCEKGLSYLVRFVMQDKWMRHALLVYLLVVHVFALGYMLVVLNPDGY